MVGVDAKFERAIKERDALQREIEDFSQAQRDLITHEVHEDAGEQIWIFRGETPRPPIDWSVRLGEVVYNLRSALDHLVWQLVLANGRRPGRHSAFPIFIDQGQFEDKAEPLLRGVSPNVKATIKSLQPCYGSDLHLWRLNGLRNIDTHRHLNLTVLAVDRGMLGSSAHNFQRLLSDGRFIPTLGPLKKDTILLRVRDLEVIVHPDFSAQVKFSEIEPQVTDLPILNTLIVIPYGVEESISCLRMHVK